MLFNSLDFAIFLPIVFILYWYVTNKNLKAQNILILIASYFFYAWWDWRFLGLIIVSTLVDYFVGLAIYKQKDAIKRKWLLWISIGINLGFLGFFKYYNFFLENFVAAFTFFGVSIQHRSLEIILPVGISFYTFQTLSYTIDIYRDKLRPTKDVVAFASFVAFFPQLVAGPIERAKNLLSQFEVKRHFSYQNAIDGLRQILWGLFKKMVIADNCAVFADEFFGNYAMYSGSTLLLGAFFFTVQIYCDFSGYSDIAIGVSRLFGFNLMKNFNFPYFSRNIAEFWRRWHISLTTWFKDYVYIPIGGNRGNKLFQVRNIFIMFLIIGFWHGAQWKFIVYGFINALYFLPLVLLSKNIKYEHSVANGQFLPTAKEIFNMSITFLFLILVRVFFRADDLSVAVNYLSGIFSSSFFTFPAFNNQTGAFITLILVCIFFLIEWIGREQNYAIEKIGLQWKRFYRWSFYYALIFCLFYFHAKQQQFIYFQF